MDFDGVFLFNSFSIQIRNRIKWSELFDEKEDKERWMET